MARDLHADVSVTAVPGPRVPVAGEDGLLPRLRARDEDAFTDVVRAWSPMMARVARLHVSTQASAEEIVQETWMAVARGIDAFEGRSSVRTWVFRILTNLAKTRGIREARCVPMSALDTDGEDGGPTIDPDRFRPAGEEWAGHWTSSGAPSSWPTPETAALGGEVRGRVADALTLLPERQRVVVTLRDVHGMGSDEVCAVLHISPANQRVLLHRGRAHVRASLEDYYRGSEREDTP